MYLVKLFRSLCDGLKALIEKQLPHLNVDFVCVQCHLQFEVVDFSLKELLLSNLTKHQQFYSKHGNEGRQSVR